MVREPLILKTDNGTDVAALLWEDGTPILWESGAEMALERQDGIPFKGIEITEYSFKSPRMGMPTLTAELYWPSCLDDEWTGKEFVELRGERYYLRQIQSSEISNNNVIKYKHSLEFKSEREILSHVYFYDAVPSVNTLESTAGHDKPCTNSTTFKFFGTIYEYADRLNCAFRYAGIGDSILQTKTHLTDADTPTGDGYCVVVSDTGDGDLTQSQNFEFEDQWLWDALSEGFDKFKIPFVFHGKKIVFNEQDKVVSHVFKYGFDNELLSIKKNNANAKIINRITFKGSSENIPYYYPNTTEYGNIILAQIEGDDKIPTNQFELINPSKLVKWMSASDVARLNVYRITEIEFSKLSYKRGDKWIAIEENQWVTLDFPTENNGSVYFSTTFTTPQQCDIVIDGIYGKLWKIEDAPPSADFTESDNLIKRGVFTRVSLTNTQGEQFTGNSLIENGKLIINRLPAGAYTFMFRLDWGNIEGEAFFRLRGIKTAVSAAGLYYWTINDKRVNNLEDIGVRFNGTPNDSMLGGGFKWTAGPRMPFQTNLMPPKYRTTNGKERYYNALNDTYDKPSGGKYIFKNPYIDGDPNEYIFTDDTIKPTIEGVKNASEQLFGEIAAIAYDSDDNDSLKAEASEDKEKNDAANYAHSFFYIKLNKFDGPHGFNLFDAASQTDPMTIQMTSGPCDGCKFKIQVAVVKDGDIEVWRNPVQVKEADGDIVDGSYSAKIDADNPQPFQQNSKENSIWLCVQKDAETFGVIMPNRSHNYMPAVGDTFNIINIDLPQGYIDAAEERGMYAMLNFMENNNEEKFNFDIAASRIFFANNPDLLDSLDENSRIKIEYDGKLYEQYVSELAIDCKDNEVLPDVKITLADTLSPTGSFVQEVIAQAADISKAVTNRPSQGGGVALDVTDTRYLRRDMDDRTEHRVSSDTAFEVGTFVSGSQGAILSIDPKTGKTLLETDYVRARMKAIYESIEVANVRSIGGKQTISPGGSISISFVDELDNAYRCYFKRKEDDKGADCRFIVGDDAYCQSFNVSNGTTQTATDKFYWRAVTAVSNDGSYIELSKTDCATDSAAPEIGDVICQLGSDDASRQSAIILSTVDENSPNITLYDGITNFTLDGKEVVDMGVDETTGKAYFHVYGNAYIGDKDGNSYLKYDNLLKELIVKAKLTVDSTVGDDVLADYIKKVSPPVEQEDIEGFVNNIVNPKIEGLQNQIDGVIETWFGEGAPTLANYPASEWGTDNLKIAHLGDLYYDNSTGTAYRFSQNEHGGYFWNTITDDAIANALAAAQRAQDTADHKRRVFTVQPTAQQAYDVGDLWVNATYKPPYSNDLLRCIVHKNAGEAFNIAHWTLASKYTDDTLAQEAKSEIAGFEYLKEAMADGITQFNGGLMLSSHIRLGKWNADKTAMEHVYAGMNGIYQNGRSLASWWGGDMVDLFNENDVRITPEPANAAKALVRMDGSAYFSHGNIGFKKDGSGWLGNDKTGIKFTPDGTMTLGSGIQVGGGDSTGVQQTLADVLNFNAGLTRLLKPYDANNQPLTWAQATDPDGDGGIKAKTLRAAVTFASVGDIVAYENGNLSGGTGGGGLDITALEDYLTTNGYATQSWVSAHFNDYVLTKAAVEAVLTGNITSHTHSQYLTQHQSLANYMTRGEIGDTYQAKSTALSFSAASGYVAARFTDAALATSAAQNYIELWGKDGWFNLQAGHLLAHGAVTATSFVKTGGTATQFLKADGSVDSNSYLLSSAYTAADILTKIKTVDGSGSGLDADLLDGVQGSSYLYATCHCGEQKTGVLVKTDVPKQDRAMFTVHINGNTYNGFIPIDTYIQFYNFNNSEIIRWTAINNGYNFGAINVFIYEGYVCLWFPQPQMFMSFNIFVSYTNSPALRYNRVISVTNTTMPTEGVTRLVTITPYQSALTTDNVASATKLKTARTINGTAFDGTAAITTAKWGTARNLTIGNTAKSVDGSGPVAWSLAEIGALGANANAVSASKLQTAHTLWGQSFDGTANVSGSLSGVEDITFNADAKIAATANHIRLLTKSGGPQGIAAAQLLASDLYSDWSKVPANGIYSKGDIATDGSLKIGGGTITWDAGTNSFIFSHTVASQGDVVAFKQ